MEFDEFEFEEAEEETSRTYCLDLDKGRIYGKIDGLEAVKQAVLKALATPRFYSLIYDGDYGSELQDGAHGKGITREYLRAMIPYMITDALSQDTRIIDIDNFEFEFLTDSVHVKFTVNTIFGDSEVGINV